MAVSGTVKTEADLVHTVGREASVYDPDNFTFRDVAALERQVENYDGTLTLSEAFAVVDSAATRAGLVWHLVDEPWPGGLDGHLVVHEVGEFCPYLLD